MSSQNDKQGFIEKLKKPFASHSRSSSSTGEEGGSATSSKDRSASKSSQEDHTYSGAKKDAHEHNDSNVDPENIVKEAYEEGRKNFHRKPERAGAHSNVVLSTAFGDVVSKPPKIRKGPIQGDPSGDFTGKKKPTELVRGSNQSSNQPTDNYIENKNPSYGNSAAISSGRGFFYDPKDTQGGTYGGNGTHEDATRAKVNPQPKLKTVPSAYQNRSSSSSENQQVSGGDIEREVYSKGREQGERDLKEQRENKPDSVSKQSKDDKYVDSSALGHHKASGNAKDGQYESLAAVSALNDGEGHSASNANAKDNSKSTSSAYGSENQQLSSKDVKSTNLSQSVPPSAKSSDYEKEIKKLDQKIAATDKEIAAFNKEGHNSAETKDENSGSSFGQNISHFAQVVAGAGVVGVGAIAHSHSKSSEDDSKMANSSVLDEAYSHGIKKGSYDAGFEKGLEDKQPSAVSPASDTYSNTKNKNQSNNNAGSETNGENAGVIGSVIGAATAMASGALGFASSNDDDESERSGLSKPGHFNPDSEIEESHSTKSDKINQSLRAGENTSGTSERPNGSDGIVGTPTKATDLTTMAEKSKGKSNLQSSTSNSENNWGMTDQSTSRKSAGTTLTGNSESSNDKSSEISGGVLGGIGATLGAAAGYVGMKGNSSSTPDKSLIQEAETKYDDVSKAPAHKTTATVLGEKSEEQGDGVQPVPGLQQSTKEKSSDDQGHGKSQSKDLEALAIGHNKKHNKKGNKSLLDAAESTHPELKNSSHGGNSVLSSSLDPNSNSLKKKNLQGSESQVSQTGNNFSHKVPPTTSKSSSVYSDSSKSVDQNKLSSPNRDDNLGHPETVAGNHDNSKNGDERTQRSTEKDAQHNSGTSETGHEDNKSFKDKKSFFAAAVAHDKRYSPAYAHLRNKNAPASTDSKTPKELSREDHDAFYNAGLEKGTHEAGQIDATKDITSSHFEKGDNEANSSDVIVEVIGIKDKELASKVAQETSRQLNHKGVEITGGKLVIDTNLNKVYHETDSKNHKDVEPIGDINPESKKNTPQRSRNHESSKASEGSKIQVAIRHIKDEEEANVLANKIVDQLRKYPSLLSETKEIKVDSKSGIITNEKNERLPLVYPRTPLNFEKSSNTAGARSPRELSPTEVDSLNTTPQTVSNEGATSSHGLGTLDPKIIQSRQKNSIEIDAINASSSEDISAVLAERRQYVEKNPQKVPRGGSKLYLDVKTGEVSDSNANKIPGLSFAPGSISANTASHSADANNANISNPISHNQNATNLNRREASNHMPGTFIA